MKVDENSEMGFDKLDVDTASSLARGISDELAEGIPIPNVWRLATVAMRHRHSRLAITLDHTHFGFYGVLLDGTPRVVFL